MPTYMKKLGVHLAMQFTGKNFNEIKSYFDDSAGIINKYMNGMLRLDTEHGRLAVRNGEYIIKDWKNTYCVCRKDDFNELYEVL